MKKKILIGMFLIAIIGGATILISKTMLWKDIKDVFKSKTTGIERKVEVYSYNGDKIKEITGDIYVKDGQGGTITMVTKDEKFVFSNVSVIISEEVE